MKRRKIWLGQGCGWETPEIGSGGVGGCIACAYVCVFVDCSGKTLQGDQRCHDITVLQALKFECYHISALARMLLEKATSNVRFAHYLYWYVDILVDLYICWYFTHDCCLSLLLVLVC